MIRRGFTLAEVVVASSVGLLLVGLVSSIFILASQGWNKTSRLQTAQQSTLVAVTRLREDFRRSRPESATIQGPVLSFLSFDDGSGSTAWDTTGTIFWKCWVQYRWKEGVLERRQSNLAAPATEVSDPPPAWPDDKSANKLGQHLVRCDWRLLGQVVLDVSLQSEFEKQRSDAHLSVLPSLYQPD